LLEGGNCSEVFHVVDKSDCSLKNFLKLKEMPVILQK